MTLGFEGGVTKPPVLFTSYVRSQSAGTTASSTELPFIDENEQRIRDSDSFQAYQIVMPVPSQQPWELLHPSLGQLLCAKVTVTGEISSECDVLPVVPHGKEV